MSRGDEEPLTKMTESLSWDPEEERELDPWSPWRGWVSNSGCKYPLPEPHPQR